MTESQLCERAGVPVLIRDVGGDERIAEAIRPVAGLERDPDPSHGGYPLADDALVRFDDLAAKGCKTHVRTIADLFAAPVFAGYSGFGAGKDRCRRGGTR